MAVEQLAPLNTREPEPALSTIPGTIVYTESARVPKRVTRISFQAKCDTSTGIIEVVERPKAIEVV